MGSKAHALNHLDANLGSGEEMGWTRMAQIGEKKE